MKLSVLILLLLTALIWGICPIFEKLALKSGDPLIGILIRSTIIAIITLIVILITGKTKLLFNLNFQTILFFGLSGVLSGLLAMWLYFEVLKMGATSKVVALTSIYPLFTTIFSIIILKETINIFQIIGTVFIVIGIWFISSFSS